MEGYIPVILMILAAIGGALFMRDKNKREAVKQKVEDAAASETEGAIDATLKFAERVKEAEEAVDAAIDARPVTDDPAADLADRLSRRRRLSRATKRVIRRRRQRADEGGS